MKIKAYGVLGLGSGLEPVSIDRRPVGADDVEIDILYCGICHSDLHQVRAETSWLAYPLVPGHEIVGRVKAVGRRVTRFSVGDLVGVGCLVGSCKRCSECDDGLEQFCEGPATFTYGSPSADAPGHTLGGYSQRIVVDEAFVLKIRHPESMLAATAPLLCAGITMYSPLRHAKIGPGAKVGIVGVGGLGHIGIKLARAMGAHVVGLTTSEGKRDEILELGAHEVVLWKEEGALARLAGRLDLIIDTVSTSHNLDPLINLLRRDGKLMLIGVPDRPHDSPDVWGIVSKRRSVTGSLIGGIAETQEMLDFCFRHGIVADVEMINTSDIASAFERMDRSDVKYRFVIDISTFASEADTARADITG